MFRFLCLFVAIAVLVCVPVSVTAVPADYVYNGFELPYFSDYETVISKYPYVIIRCAEDGFGIWCFSSNDIYASGSDVYTGSSIPGCIYLLSEDGSRWEYCKLYSFRADHPVISSANGVSYIWSNFNIYDLTGSLVYAGDVDSSQDLTLQAVTEERLSGMAQYLGGVVLTLTVCGVACFASFVVLRLFGRRALLYF